MSKLARPESYFFSESTVIQTSDQAFGPVVGSETTQYRTTAKFTAVADVKAYAICAGQVFLQPHTDAAKVNLVLRPYRQPMNGLSIKYLVYRGLKKTDFIPSGDTDLVGHAQVGSATAFIQLLWDQLKAFNGWTDTEANAATFLAKWIGYDPVNQAADTLIDDYFFMADAYGDENNETLKPFEFPMVPRGTHLGNFTGEYGLDIVLSDGDYKALTSSTGFQFDLAYARAAENILDTAQVPTGYIEKQYREAITHFMDPAAFWGLHYRDGTVWVNESGTAVKKKGQAIYDDIVDNFATKNKVYLHVQGHLGRSFNYYGAYAEQLGSADVIKQGIAADTTTATPYATHAWPVLIWDTEQTHTNTTNSFFLQLIFNATSTVMLYGQVGQLAEGAENNFILATQLVPETTVAQDGSTVQEAYGNPVEIVVPAVDSGANKANVAGYVHLIYQGVALTATEDVDGTPVERPIKPLDTIFGPVNIAQRLASAGIDVIAWSYSNVQHLVHDGENTLALQTKMVADKLTYDDGNSVQIQDRVVYEAQLVEGIGEGVLNRSNAITFAPNAGNVPFESEVNNFYVPSLPYYLTTENFTDGTVLVAGIRLNQLNDNPIQMMYLGITKAQQDELVSQQITNDLKVTRLYLTPLANTSHFVSQEDKTYNKYHLQVLGENTSGALEVLGTNTVINIYTLDYKCYFSPQFVEELPDLLPPAIRDTIVSNFNQY